MKRVIVIVISLVMTGCTKTETIPIANNVVQLNTTADSFCGGNGARKVASTMASVETIRRGYDKYIVVGTNAQKTTSVVGYTPTQSYTTLSAFGTAQTSTYGGQPIVDGEYDQTLTIQMFRNGDPAGENAISARQQLGPDWQEVVENGGPKTCR